MLGAALRTFRQRRRQPHNGRGWTLDDLAVATHDDKAHLSRIERGLTSPGRDTLTRLCEALALVPSETEFVLRLGGFVPRFGPPDANAAASVIQWLSRRARAYPIPLTLLSIDARVWYANALWLRLTGLTPARFRACIAGRPLPETYFAPCSTTRIMRERYGNREEVQRRTIARFRTAAGEGHVPIQRIAAALADARVRSVWEEFEGRSPVATLAGEQAEADFAYPGRGMLRFDTWVCPVQMDHRFLAILYAPRDLHTRASLAALRRDPRPVEGEACSLHGYRGRL